MNYPRESLTHYKTHVECMKSFYYQEKDETTSLLKYIDAGPQRAKTLVIVHGTPSSSWSFRKIIYGLSQLKIRIIAIDHLGYGASQKTKKRQLLSIPLHAQRLLTLLKELKIKKPSLLIHDIGGPIAWEMMDIAPKYFHKLILLNTLAYKKGFKVPNFISVLFFRLFIALMKEKGILLVIRFLGHPGIVDHKEILEGYKIKNVHWAYDTFLSNLSQIKRRLPAYRDILRKRSYKALIFWGDEDKNLIIQESIPLFQRDLDVQKVKIFPGVYHLIQEEKASTIIQDTKHFL